MPGRPTGGGGVLLAPIPIWIEAELGVDSGGRRWSSGEWWQGCEEVTVVGTRRRRLDPVVGGSRGDKGRRAAAQTQ